MDAVTLLLVSLLAILFVGLAIFAYLFRGFRKFLPSISYIAQILIVIVAVYGYVFTIKPAYDRQKLENEIEDSQKKITQLRKKEKSVRLRLNEVENQRKTAVYRLSSIDVERKNAESELELAEQKLVSVRKEIHGTYWSLYVANVRDAAIGYFYRYFKKENNNRNPNSIEDAKKLVLTPYEAIHAVLNNRDYVPEKYPMGNEFFSLVPEKIKIEVLKKINAKLRKNKARLSEHRVNSESIARAYENSGLIHSDGSPINPDDDGPLLNVQFVASYRISEFFKHFEPQQ